MAVFAACLLLSCAPVMAQNADSLTTARVEDALARVRRYAGVDVALARTLADSLATAVPPTASVMPEVLYAKASIAPSAADAERDYARIVNDYRFAARVPDALMRLAQLESARNNRIGALRHLDRLLRDHGDSPARARASLLAGRLRMDGGDPARGCELLAAAYAASGPLEADVRDQATTAGAKCPTPVAKMADRDPTPMGVQRGMPRTVVAPAPAPVAPPTTRRGATATVSRSPVPGARGDSAPRPRLIVVDSTPKRVATTPAPAVDTTARVRAAARRDSLARVQATKAAQRDSQMRAVAKAAAAAAQADRDSVQRAIRERGRRDSVNRVAAAAATARRDSIARVAAATPQRPVAPTPAPVTAPVAATTPPTTSVPASSERFAVQFAAYPARPGAEKYAAQLRDRGIAARVEGTVAPFRVRAGRFRTREEAEAAVVTWRRPGQAAIVVSLGPAAP